ncbi:MAG: DNA translocase FtsK, partial [Firmicutes bacterium]|nr:DNA translocase FtsK [Bacillota bacterium]
MGYVLFKAFGFPGAYIILCAVALLGLALLTGLSLGELISQAALGCRDAVRRTGRGLVDFVYVEVPEEPPAAEQGDTAEKAAPREELPAQERPRRPRRSPEVAAQLLPPPRSDAVTDYELPPLHLLSRPPRKQVRSTRDETEHARLLEETLESFGVKARVIQVSRGPAVTRYEVQPAAGVKVSRIVSLADDIALSLAAPGVRIEAPVPGKAVVGIEVPNKEVSMVHLRDLLESREFTQATSPLTVALGKDIAGNPVVADLARMPHLLIAGATGSGKSVCLNTLIASILFR